MKIYLLGFLMFIAVVLSVTGCRSITLSDQEAIRLIREAYAYPKLVSISLNGTAINSPLGQEVVRLVREGFLTPGDYWTGYKPTAKGKDLVERCVWNGLYGEWEVFRPFALKADVSRIVDKRIDKQKGTAVVIYEVIATPTPYLAELKKIDPQRVAASLPTDDKCTAQAYFERWEKGWRISN